MVRDVGVTAIKFWSGARDLNTGPHGLEPCWLHVLQCPGGSPDARLNSNCRTVVSVRVLLEPPGSANLCPRLCPGVRPDQPYPPPAGTRPAADIDDPRQTARYSFGEMPMRRWKAARTETGAPSPVRRPMFSTVSVVVSNISRARSMRASASHAIGDR